MDKKWKQRVNLNPPLRKKVGAQMIRVAPGEYVPLCPADEVPKAGIALWEKTRSGTYQAVPVTDRMLRLGAELASLLGFSGDYDTLYRLARAGFIETIKVAPRTILLNVDSYYRHLRRCAEDPWFWENSKRMERYLKGVPDYDGQEVGV